MANQGNVTPFRLLGPVEVVADGSPIAFARRQHRDLLALLLLNANRMLSVDEVIEAMWGGAAPATALAQVRNMASAVRSAMARPGLATLDGRGGYRLRLDERHIDLVVFDELIRRGRASGDSEPLRGALRLWRGQPLGGIHAAYAGAARVRIEEQRLAAVQDLFDAELARGRHADIVAELTVEVWAHPLAERLVAQLMTALYGSARQAEALAAYRQFRERLVAEHGLEPGPQLRELELRILRNERVLARPMELVGARGGHPDRPPLALCIAASRFRARYGTKQ
jgi:DNA-binding SARP family transcriptional activator